jgi:hypothetical protein
MERIESLERANKRWRFVGISAVLALIVVLVVTSHAFSQREQKKADAQKPQPQPAAPVEFVIDRTPAPVTYANYVRVRVTPEELVVDFGLNTQTKPEPDEPIRFSSRVVMNYYTAKRLSNALQQVVQQHEATYGPLELDFQKRALQGAKRPAAGGK